MDRKKFQNNFKNIDEYLLGELCDIIELCEEIDYPVYSKYFYPPNISETLTKINIGGITFKKCGLTFECEKNIIVAIPNGFLDDLYFPIKYFKIINKSKFKVLEHKDYLGTIMSLGLKREVLGDLIVENNCCYGVVIEDIYPLLFSEIKEIGHTPVEIVEITQNEIPSLKFEEKTITVSSLRIDNIVSEIINISRGKSVELLENGSVLLNYNIEKEKNLGVKTGDIITIKKYGKFKILEELGINKKEKIRIKIKKFIWGEKWKR